MNLLIREMQNLWIKLTQNGSNALSNKIPRNSHDLSLNFDILWQCEKKNKEREREHQGEHTPNELLSTGTDLMWSEHANFKIEIL